MEGWGWHLNAQTHGMSLEGLCSEVRTEIGRVTAPAKGFVLKHPEVATVALVAAPNQERLLTVAEVPELAAVVLEREHQALDYAIHKNRKPAIILGVIFLLAAPFLGVMGGLAFPLVSVSMDAVLPFLEALRLRKRLRQDPAGFLASLDRGLRFKYWLDHRRPHHAWRSWGLVGTWIALFCLQMITGLAASIPAAALVKDRLGAEPWRLMTGPFLHGSVMHLLMNVMGMLALGPLVERMTSPRILLPLWASGALGGSVLSWMLLPGKASVGASGGLMALIGYLAMVGYSFRRDLPREFVRSQVQSIIFIGVLGLLAWQVIDNGAHLGGLILGLGVGWSQGKRSAALPLKEGPGLVLCDGVAVALLVATAAYTTHRLWGPA